MAGLQKLELERLHSGNHEIEICEIESEQDLLSHQQGCLKNPGHAHFIAVNDFTIHHLPDHYHDKDFYQLIKILAFLTVRVAVATVSSHRPEFFHGTDIPYPFHGRGGTQGWVRYGTGRVWDVESYTEDDDQTCPCSLCRHSMTSRKSWGKVHVDTAAHVVFDEAEAKATTCRWGYDADTSPVVNLEGVGVTEVNAERDTCRVTCITHDVQLVEKLKDMVQEYDEFFWNVTNKYEPRPENNQIVVVSHPHGCSKQISLGKFTRRNELPDKRTSYIYTAATCPGSSGAAVFVVGREGWEWYTHSHCGANSDGNHSGYRWF